MNQQRKDQHQDQERAQEQDGSLKNSDRFGHLYQEAKREIDSDEDSSTKKEQKSEAEQH
ncbi:MAG: hypothetical protein ICV66_10215 [Chitinophagaceae bacterium]|nr:hypothetical protein [Chitinophagaceae bacterium]